jgi:hypothetical protein
MVELPGPRWRATSLLASPAVAQAFVQAGAASCLVAYLEPSLLMVRDALEACRSRLRAFPGMSMIVDWLEARGRVVDLDPVYVLAVDDLTGLYHGAESGTSRDEIATVYGGLQLRDQGRGVTLVLESGVGRSLGRSAGLPLGSMPELVGAMVGEGALSDELARGIMRPSAGGGIRPPCCAAAAEEPR